MTRSTFTLGQKIAAASALFITGATLVSARDMGNSNHDKKEKKHNVGAEIRLCLKQRRTDGFFNRNLSREEKLEIRNDFRACIRAAIAGNRGHSSRSSSSSSMSTSSSSRSSKSSKSSMSSVRKVEIENFDFDPSVLNVKVGTTVRWKNEDDAPHTVTSTGTGGLTLNSGTLDEDETYSYTFTSSGTFNYKCNFHPNMTGSVIVSE